MKFFRPLVLAVAAAMAAGSMVGAIAQPITPEEMNRLPQFRSPTFSRDGKFLAALAPVGEKMNIVVLDMETRKVQSITSFKDFDVVRFNWLGSQRLTFTLGNFNAPSGAGRSDGGGLYAVDRDGSNGKELSPSSIALAASAARVYRGFDYVQSVPGSSDEIIASSRRRDQTASDLYRLNTRTGRATIMSVDRPNRTSDWHLDSKLVPRVVTESIQDTNSGIVHYRKDASSPWVEIARIDGDKPPAFEVLTFDGNDKTLQVATNKFGPTMEVYRFDPETKQFGEKIAAHPRFDMGAEAGGGSTLGPIVDPETNSVLGYQVQADKPETTWIDPERLRIQTAVDGALPGMINSTRKTPGDPNKYLVTSYSAVQPAQWFIFDDKAKTLQSLLSSRPWLEGKLTEQRPFVLKTRDGLEIPSYYFVPKGYKPGTKLPTVVHIHGGPFARADTYATGTGVNEAQLLVSHGYAVILPNFRITPGLGNKIFYSGFGTVGRQMSEDHEDAAKWAIEQGIADPKKICMSGSSYGGYATLQALAKTPELFKCGVAGLMVSDYKLQLTSVAGDTASRVSGVAYWKQVLGVKSLDEPIVAAISPALYPEKIKNPLFIWAGLDDVRTPIEQTNAMIRGLERTGNPPKDVFIAKEEAHGFGKFENRVELGKRMLKFLDEQIGSKSK